MDSIGTSTADVDATRGAQHTRCYRQGVLIDEGFGLEDVSEHLLHAGVVWVDLCPPDPADLDLVASVRSSPVMRDTTSSPSMP